MTGRPQIRRVGRIAYLSAWLLLLVFVEFAHDSTETSDSEMIRSILLGTVSALALPVSLVVVGLLMAAAMLLSLFDAQALEWLSRTVLGSREWFRLQFFLWWLLMFAASYWQWFHLAPRLVSAMRRRASRGRTPPPGEMRA